MPCKGLRSRIVVSGKDTLRHSPLMVLGIAEEVLGMSEGLLGILTFMFNYNKPIEIKVVLFSLQFLY